MGWWIPGPPPEALGHLLARRGSYARRFSDSAGYAGDTVGWHERSAFYGSSGASSCFRARTSQALINRHSRPTVVVETPRTCAVSSTDILAKYDANKSVELVLGNPVDIADEFIRKSYINRTGSVYF